MFKSSFTPFITGRIGTNYIQERYPTDKIDVSSSKLNVNSIARPL